jgi:hypothetical protein
VELVDVNEDGRPDLVMGGHEFGGAATSVFINPGTNNFASVTPSVIPTVSNEGVVLDFTVTGNGTTRALWYSAPRAETGRSTKARSFRRSRGRDSLLLSYSATDPPSGFHGLCRQT